jgi:hypothetical protein
MQTAIQFSIFLVNKPGVLAQVTSKLAERKINVVALTMMDSMEHGVLRLVVDETERAREALQTLNIPLTETEVLVIPITNRPGAFADVCNKLAGAHININYAYSAAGAPGGRARAVLKVADTQKATRVLTSKKTARKERTGRVRRSPAQRQ